MSKEKVNYYELGQPISLVNILEEQEMCFKVPNYQRGFSWEAENQVEDLLNDINECTRSDDYEHYMGTIVAAKNENEFELVDGQQRLTTLFILIKIIYEKINLRNNNLANNNQYGFLSDKITVDGTFIKPNKEIGLSFFKNIIIRNLDIENPKNKSQKNLIAAKEKIEKWSGNIVDSSDIKLINILDTVLNKLNFTIFLPSTKKDIGIMFEIINNRGKRLSELEKVKNYLIYIGEKYDDKNLTEKVKDLWVPIINNLSSADKTKNLDEEEFLKACWIVFVDPNKDKSYHVYKNLKMQFEECRNNNKHNQYIKQLSKFISFMSKCSTYYKNLFKENEDLNNQISEVLRKLRYHPNYASILPLYLSICTSLDDDKQLKLLKILEKFNFRIYVCPEVTKRSDKFQGRLFHFAYRFYRTQKIDKGILQSDVENDDLLTTQELIRELIGEGDEQIASKLSTSSFIRSLTLDIGEEYNYADWNGLKYFLANYEIDLLRDETKKLKDYLVNKGSGSLDNFQKEHLWAIANRKKINNRRQDLHEKRRLGNFSLLKEKWNKTTRADHLWNKIDVYGKNSNLRMISEISSKFINKANEYAEKFKSERKSTNWYWHYYRKLNDLREEKMINFALKRWGFKSEKNKKVEIHSPEKDKRPYKGREGEEIFQI